MSTYPSYIKTAEQREAVDQLRELLPPGTVVRTILRHVSRSGMSRRISAVVIQSDGTTRSLDHLIDMTGLFKRSTEPGWGLRVGGTGMDMGFHLVYSLSRMLYNNGAPCTGSNGYTPSGKRSKMPQCNSNEHFNDHTMPYLKGFIHADGGYALRQEWL